jgi:hypothetical protein
MAASLTIEEDRGTYVGSAHLHEGYYAGDFTRTAFPHASLHNRSSRPSHLGAFSAPSR